MYNILYGWLQKYTTNVPNFITLHLSNALCKRFLNRS